MIPRTTRNQPRLQRPCATCGHTEWDHYGPGGACDGNDCTGCQEFVPIPKVNPGHADVAALLDGD